MDEPLNNSVSSSVSPTTLMTPPFEDSPITSSEADVKPHLKMQDFTRPRTEALMVRKPVKKRKSWGQQLPDPKTNLAPRKRAKTEDEKEQRRIERIKRNRAAAHNSRERKRVEAEHLANANDVLLQRIQTLQRRLAQQDAQLEKCKELLPEGLPHVKDDEIAYDKDYFPDSPSSTTSPAPSSVFTIDPRSSFSMSDTSPSSISSDHNVPIKLEDDLNMSTPALFSDQQPQAHHPETGDSIPSQGLDETQHSAAMLCDLQCPSSPQSPRSTRPTSAWISTMLILLQLITTTCHYNSTMVSLYQTTLMTLWTLFPWKIKTLQQQSRISSTTRQPTTSPPRPIFSPISLTLIHQAHQISKYLFRQEQQYINKHKLSHTAMKAATAAMDSKTRRQQIPSCSTLAHLLVATGLCSSVSSAHILALDYLSLIQLVAGSKDAVAAGAAGVVESGVVDGVGLSARYAGTMRGVSQHQRGSDQRARPIKLAVESQVASHPEMGPGSRDDYMGSLSKT